MLDSGVLLVNTQSASFTINDIRNRRFMFSPDTGELILGRQYKGSKLYASHAAEHEETGTATPFDSFVRGWVGNGGEYKDGIIHFAPPVYVQDPQQFDRAYSTLQMFASNGATDKTIVRGFGPVWEQPLEEILKWANSAST